MTLFSVTIVGLYPMKGQPRREVFLVDGKDKADAQRIAQKYFLEKYPKEAIENSHLEQITEDIRGRNTPSSRVNLS